MGPNYDPQSVFSRFLSILVINLMVELDLKKKKTGYLEMSFRDWVERWKAFLSSVFKSKYFPHFVEYIKILWSYFAYWDFILFVKILLVKSQNLKVMHNTLPVVQRHWMAFQPWTCSREGVLVGLLFPPCAVTIRIWLRAWKDLLAPQGLSGTFLGNI